MSDLDLMCNVRTCRKILSAEMWVTVCSHVFCHEHAERVQPNGGSKCKACGTPLRNRYDIVRTNGNPPEDFKSMLLTGYRPELILDIAARAVAFWNYQMAQEMNFQMELSKHKTLKIEEATAEYQTTLLSMQKELKITKQKCDAHAKEVDAFVRKMQELRDQLAEKNKEIRTLQRNLNACKLKMVGKTSEVVHDAPQVSSGRHVTGGDRDPFSVQNFPIMTDSPDQKAEEQFSLFNSRKRDFSFHPVVESASQMSQPFLSQPTRQTSNPYSLLRK